MNGDSALPEQRQHPLRPGSSKETTLLNWVEAAVLRINRRHAKRFSRSFTETDAEETKDAGEDVPGYDSFGEVAVDIDRALDVLWVSNTREYLYLHRYVYMCMLMAQHRSKCPT